MEFTERFTSHIIEVGWRVNFRITVPIGAMELVDSIGLCAKSISMSYSRDFVLPAAGMGMSNLDTLFLGDPF